MSFKFIAVAYSMLGATAATGYFVGGNGGGGTGGSTTVRVAQAPAQKVERVQKLEVPPKPEPIKQAAAPAPAPAPEAAAPVAATVPVAAAMIIAEPTPAPAPAPAPVQVAQMTQPPTPAPPPKASAPPAATPPPAARQSAQPAEQAPASGHGYMVITASMMVNPWTGEWLTSDDRSMGYIVAPYGMTSPGPAAPAAAPVMVAEQTPAATEQSAPATAPMSAPVPTPAKVAGKTAAKPSATAHPNGYMAHLASYRSESGATAGWKTLQKAHRDLLINRAPIMVEAEVPGQGTFVRLMANGFTQLTDASEFCSEMKATGQYCIPIKAK